MGNYVVGKGRGGLSAEKIVGDRAVYTHITSHTHTNTIYMYVFMYIYI